MSKLTKSLLLVAMMASSGFAAAQAAPPVKSGTDGGEGPSAQEKAKPGSMAPSRAEVKSEAAPMKSGVDGGSGSAASTKMTAAERRAAAANKGKRTPASKADVQKDGKSAN